MGWCFVSRCAQLVRAGKCHHDEPHMGPGSPKMGAVLGADIDLHLTAGNFNSVVVQRRTTYERLGVWPPLFGHNLHFGSAGCSSASMSGVHENCSGSKKSARTSGSLSFIGLLSNMAPVVGGNVRHRFFWWDRCTREEFCVETGGPGIAGTIWATSGLYIGQRWARFVMDVQGSCAASFVFAKVRSWKRGGVSSAWAGNRPPIFRRTAPVSLNRTRLCRPLAS